MRLKERYNKEIKPGLIKKFGYANINQAPRLKKAVINIGYGRQSKEKAYIDNVASILERISGQKPVLTKAKKSISSFKIREGMPIGAKVTLRGDRMYDFIDKLVQISFARIRDFRGLKETIVDRSGNLTVGFTEHLAFPEVRSDEADQTIGLEISINTSAQTREEGLEMFRLIGFPFKKAD